LLRFTAEGHATCDEPVRAIIHSGLGVAGDFRDWLADDGGGGEGFGRSSCFHDGLFYEQSGVAEP